MYNVHCKQIVFGASADNGYASFLSSFFLDTDVSSRLRLLKGPPWSFEFKNILPKFRWAKFPNVFNNNFISNESTLQQNTWRRSEDVEHFRTSGQLSSTTVENPAVPWRPSAWGQMQTGKASANGTSMAASKPVLPMYETRGAGVDDHSDGEGTYISAQLQSVHLSGSPRPSSSRIATTGRTVSPVPEEVVAALINCTRERLEKTPTGIDFGVVKRRVEQKLCLTPAFWGRDESSQWFSRSKNVIKMAVEDWVEQTNNPPPGNATWMLHNFTSTDEAPSAIMKNPASAVWRTKRDIASVGPSLSVKQASLYGVPPEGIYYNHDEQRIDVPIDLSTRSRLANELRDWEPRLCNTHHLVRHCLRSDCPYDHDSVLSIPEVEALAYLSRCQPCPYGLDCDTMYCTKGHTCPNGSHCSRGKSCRFAKVHGVDTSTIQFMPRCY